jgi:hypothetical protein
MLVPLERVLAPEEVGSSAFANIAERLRERACPSSSAPSPSSIPPSTSARP